MENDLATLTRQLRILKGFVKWDDMRSRFSFFSTFNSLIKDWKAPYPNLLDVFTPEEIEKILNFAVDDPAGDAEHRERFIEFVAATGYKDALQKRGRPVLDRTTPLHRLYHSRLPGDKDRMARALFRIYDKVKVNCKETRHLEDQIALSVSHFHVACCISDGHELVKRFLDAGQDPNVATRDGVTPLSLALTLRNEEVVELLLRKNALPYTPAGLGPPFSALHHLCKCCNDNNYDIKLAKKFFDVCVDIGKPLEINAKDSAGDTPLHVALSYNCSKEFLGFLLEKGADPNAANHAKSTPLHVICQNLYVPGLLESFFNLVREKGKSVDIDARDSRGWTPLHSALRAGNSWAAAFLLQNGASPNAADKKGCTPERIIKEQYDVTTEEYLRFALQRDLNRNVDDNGQQ